MQDIIGGKEYFYKSQYVYPNTNCLINKFGITDENKLEDIERKIVALKLVKIIKSGKIGDLGMHHFLGIHYELFSEIYDFAGKFRIENIAKDNFKFAEYKFIEQEVLRIFYELKKENYLKGKNKEELSNRLAYYMSEINVLHPFREGNGRTYREYIRQLSKYNGYNLNWSRCDSKKIFTSTVKSTIDYTDLKNDIYICLED